MLVSLEYGLLDPTIRAPVVSIPTPVTTFTLTHIVVHPSRPLPTSISQDDPQYMLFETNRTWVESVYPTKKETIKIR
jgi:oligosaccharyltransferase complex subunit alpha (ribophorin I)